MVSTKLNKGRKNFDVEKCFEKRDRFRFDLSIQRHEVWNKEKKSLFIHSMLLGYPLDNIYTMDNEGDNYYWVLDGKQRLTTFISYLNNEFELVGEDITPIDGEEVLGKKFEDLSEDLQDELKEVDVTLIHFKGLDREQRDRLFYRLNNGVSLSKMEQTRALSGEFMDEVSKVVDTDLFKEKFRMTEKARRRFKDVETVIQCLILLEHGEDLNGLGSADIRKYVKNKKETEFKDSLNEFYKVIGYIETALMTKNNKETKFLRKSNMPVVIKIAQMAKEGNMISTDFGDKLVSFFNEDFDKNGEYALLLKAGSSKKENILRRLEILEKYMKEAKVNNDFKETLRLVQKDEEKIS